jgi:hypothetical protein
MRTRRWLLRTAFAATASTIGLVATGAVLSPVSADAPTKVGWWTVGGGASNPSPDVNAGGMRVAVAPQGGIASYGAVEYSIPSDASGTLELAVTQATPTPPNPPGAPVTFTPLGNVQACPTKDDSWKAGDHQDIASGPAYDCTTYHFNGAISSDGKTMTFLIDGAAAQLPGTPGTPVPISLAIVPIQTTAIYTAGTDAGTDATPPYFVDFDKPAATSLQIDTSSIVTPPTDPPTTTGGTTSGGSVSTGGTTTASGVTFPAPMPVTGTVSTDTTIGQTPVVAGQQPTQNYAAPAAATAPTGPSENRRDLLLVLLILVLFGILYTQNATGAARVPRVLAGPRAVPVPVGVAGATADPAASAAMTAALMPLMPARGLGRFAKPRSGSARPLI